MSIECSNYAIMTKISTYAHPSSNSKMGTIYNVAHMFYTWYDRPCHLLLAFMGQDSMEVIARGI